MNIFKKIAHWAFDNHVSVDRNCVSYTSNYRR